MAVILLFVYTRGLRRLGGIAIGGIVGLDIFFLAFISDVSMNSARFLAPALVFGVLIICGFIGQLRLSAHPWLIYAAE
jgi:aquaporin Z